MKALSARLLFACLPFALGGALATAACHAPVNIQTPAGQRAYRADEVVKRLGEFQNAVIDANRANKVKTADARLIVAWISGDRNATPPALGAVDVLSAAPAGWQATLVASWATVRSRALDAPALASWVPIIDGLLQGVQ